ncbi:MAG: DUF1549 domain-containing protein [Pirellulales bacterium]
MGCSKNTIRIGFGRLRKTCAWMLVMSVVVMLETSSANATPETVSFNRDIRPILSDNCFSCHGPDQRARQAGLRLDGADFAQEELASGARAIVPHDIGASELVSRIMSLDPDVVMPPPEAKHGRLSMVEINTLRQWITEGAEYESHWSFVPPTEPSEGNVTFGIDRLVEARLARRGLKRQPQADNVTLIRRASFDITGLPPTVDEVHEFVSDTSAGSYEKLLDRLFASPRYGERMAVDWLDLSRYSDSYGFQIDRPRPTMWPWRDWVIQAFNNNLPWNQFVTWQLAGDLLPNATDEQVLATAFNRLHQQEAEGGSVEEEYRVNYVNDRVTTFGTAFLGMTLECCRCHDHKYDPISQEEYYSLFAFFDDIDEAGLYSYFTPATPTPKMRLLDNDARVEISKAQQMCRDALVGFAAAENKLRTSVEDWIEKRADMPPALLSDGVGGIQGELVRYDFNRRRHDTHFANLIPTVQDPSKEQDKKNEKDKKNDGSATAPAAISLVSGKYGQAVLLTGDHPVSTSVGNFHRSDPFTVSLWMYAPQTYKRAVVFHRSKAWTDAASRGYELLLLDGSLQWSLIHFWPGDAASVRMKKRLPLNQWVHVTVTSDGSGKASGLRIWMNGHLVDVHHERDNLTRDITGGGGDSITIGQRMRDKGFKGGRVDDFRVFGRELCPLEIRELVRPGEIHAALADRHSIQLLTSYAGSSFDQEVVSKRKALATARRNLSDLVEKQKEIMVMQDLPEAKVAYVLNRGEYNSRGKAVLPDVPHVLPPFPNDQPRNRLGLARWLTHADHPLLARVTVNRIWQALFGVGLVLTPEDLGSQSTRPEYPEVLDLLAWKFSHSKLEGGFGWDLKLLIKTIMMSKIYRQRSFGDGRTMEDDSRNIWLARGPTHRLSAEMIRDGLLAASGLLVEKIGGPPVKTYDMPESFKPAKADSGEALYRRSLYTFWRRSGPAPVLEAFDVPNRVVCVARRDTTNTPLHALVLLNAPQFVEAARVLASKMIVASDGQLSVAAEKAFERLTSRQPLEIEKNIIRNMIADQKAWYDAHPDDAKKFLAIGQAARDDQLSDIEVASLASVINALMNYDGSVVKR